MSAPKFTSGPWHMALTPKPVAGQWCEIKDADGNVLGELFDDAGDYERTIPIEANARLIAATPELYEACEDALEALKLLAVGMSHDRAALDMIKPHIDELETALAKARGETA